jgi:hypothetical protein
MRPLATVLMTPIMTTNISQSQDGPLGNSQWESLIASYSVSYFRMELELNEAFHLLISYF